MNRCRNNQGFIKFSLRQINSYSLICLLTVVFLSDSVGAITKIAELQIAQQSATKKENLANTDIDPKLKALLEEADKLREEGINLQQPGISESQKQAIAKWEQALKIYQRQDVRTGFDKAQINEAALLFDIGSTYLDLGEKKKAVKYFENSLVIYRELKDSQFQYAILKQIALPYTELGEKQKALDSASEALRLAQTESSLSQISQIMHTLDYVASIYSQNGEDQKAIEYYNQALDIAKQINNQSKQAEILASIAGVYIILGESDQALNFSQQALAISEKTNNLLGKLENLLDIASAYAGKGESQQVDKYVKQALQLESEIEQRIQQNPEIILDQGCNLDQIPEQERQSKKTECVASAKKKLIFIKYLNRRDIANHYTRLFDNKQIIFYIKQQLTLASKLGIPLEEADGIQSLGFTYSLLGDTQKALEYYNQALAKFKALNDPLKVASTLQYRGDLYNDQGEYQKAIDDFKEAGNIFLKIDRQYEVFTLMSLAGTYRDLGDYEQSLTTFQNALKISQQMKFEMPIASIYNGIFSVYIGRGKFFEDVNGSVDEARTDYQAALESSKKALKYYHEKGDTSTEITNLINIAVAHRLLKDYPQAISFSQQALALSRKSQLKYQERRSLSILSAIYRAAGKYPEALETSNQSILLSRQAEDTSDQANGYQIQGKIYSGMKQPQQAIEAFKQSLTLRQKIQDTKTQAIILYEMAKVERDRGNLTVALENIQQATDIIENSRTKVNNPDLRTSFFATKQDYYKFKIDLLMQLHKKQPSKGYNALALNTSERSRARGLVDLLAEAGANIRKGINPQLLAQEKELQQSLNAKEKARNDILSKSKGNDAAKATAEELTKEIANIIRQQQELKTKILTESPQYASLKYPQPLELKGIQQQLDKDTILLQYSLGKERSYLWLVTPDSLQAYELPKGEDIEKAVANFRDVILVADSPYGKAHPDDINQPASQLSQMILAPVAKKLGKKRLVIVADGALQTIPFSALADPETQSLKSRSLSLARNAVTEALPPEFTRGRASRIAFPGSSLGTRKQDKSPSPPKGEVSYQPLLVNHEIVNLPSITAIATQRKLLNNRPLSPKTLAILADPVFSAEQAQGKPESLGPELQRAMRNLKRSDLRPLPGTRVEAEAMLKLVPSGQSTHAYGADANYNFATNPVLKQYQHLFFATHGLADPKQPELSGIALAQVDKNGKPVKDEEGYLRLGDIFNMDWAAELVVLSACQTGLGFSWVDKGLNVCGIKAGCGVTVECQ